MRAKRSLDLFLTVVGALVWVPTVLGAALMVLVFSGRPVFYRSMRRVSSEPPMRVVKFRTMVRNAAEIANRDTVPVQGTRFLNIPPDSPLYTRVGRLLERFALTELPQFVHVLRGEMSIIGNRPLPQNVIDCLSEEHPHTRDRFLTPAGLTGPAQLVGRDCLSDADRLTLEGAYCRAALNSYSIRLDVMILVYTVLIVLHLKKGMDVPGVLELIDRHSSAPKVRGRRTTVLTALVDPRPGCVTHLPVTPVGPVGSVGSVSALNGLAGLVPSTPEVRKAQAAQAAQAVQLAQAARLATAAQELPQGTLASSAVGAGE